MRREVLEEIILDLKAERIPRLDEGLRCFSPSMREGSAHINEDGIMQLAASLSAADLPTFERALRAIDNGELAWLGFKFVYDAVAAQENVDNEVTRKYGEQGSADGLPLVFFCSDEKEIVASREYSPRDAFQMKDVTRGPSMHNDQFDGLTWTSEPLFEKVRVWLLGASDSSSEVAALADHVGFEVIAVDYDEAFLSASRFPKAQRILLEGGSFDGLFEYEARPEDYVCVLTRGHMFDPQGCVWAVRNGVCYVGMMGCKGKNATVHDLVVAQGVTEEQWESIKRPIGLKFGAKTPAELAIAIVAELVDVRYKHRYSAEARERHEVSVGR